jgi:hypothetical protein
MQEVRDIKGENDGKRDYQKERVVLLTRGVLCGGSVWCYHVFACIACIACIACALCIVCIACCLLLVACCLLLVACCLLLACCVLRVACCVLRVACCVRVVCCVLRVACVLCIAYCVLRIAYCVYCVYCVLRAAFIKIHVVSVALLYDPHAVTSTTCTLVAPFTLCITPIHTTHTSTSQFISFHVCVGFQ